MNKMNQFLNRMPEAVTHTNPKGGLFIWVSLPDQMNALDLLRQAVDKKVAYVPGTHFFVNGGHLNTLRLNFSNSTLEQIATGMQTLCDLIENNIF